MAENGRRVKNGATVKKHHSLNKATEAELRDNPCEVLKNADRGIQTAIVGKDGKSVVAVVGLNGFRYCPDPDPDPLDEVLRSAVEGNKGGDK